MRQCRKCGQVYPLTKEYFGHQPNGSYRYTCRACVRRNVQRHYYENRWQVIERAGLRSDTRLSAAERIDLKNRLIARDGAFICFYCKRPLDHNFHIDHKQPISIRGQHDFSNCVLGRVDGFSQVLG